MFEYWKSTFGLKEQFIYDEIYRFAREGEGTITVSCAPQVAIDIFNSILFDHPELFYVSGLVQTAYRYPNTDVTLKRLFNPSQIAQLSSCMSGVAERFKGAGGDVEQIERNVMEYLVRNVRYALNDDYNQNAAAALCYKRAQCSGIAKAAKFLFDGAGVKSLVVPGEVSHEGRSGSHAWNIVEVNGKWYHLDPTLILGANLRPSATIHYPFFNYSDALIRKTHRWKGRTPMCGDDKFDRLAERNFAGVNPGTNLPTVHSEAEIEALIVKQNLNGVIKFFFEGGQPLPEKQKTLHAWTGSVLQKHRFAGQYGVGYENGIWIVTLQRA